jgi:hypothetical protein
MKSLLKSFINGYIDLFTLAPLSPPAPLEDYGDLPGPVRDAQNLAADWRRVGDSLRRAMAIEKTRHNLPDFEGHE